MVECMNKSILTPLLIAGLLSWGQVRAHHSFSTHYDMGQLIEITGVVAEVKLRNPHSFLLIDVTTEEGVVERWEVEAHAIPLMRRMGFEMDTMQVGDTLTIRGPRARTDKNLTFAGQIILEDGTEFSLLQGALGPQLTAAFVQDASEVQTDGSILDRVVGRWGHITEDNGAVGETPMALSSAGRLARANYDPRETPAMNCIAPNLPSLFHAPYLLEIRADDEQPAGPSLMACRGGQTTSTCAPSMSNLSPWVRRTCATPIPARLARSWVIPALSDGRPVSARTSSLRA